MLADFESKAFQHVHHVMTSFCWKPHIACKSDVGILRFLSDCGKTNQFQLVTHIKLEFGCILIQYERYGLLESAILLVVLKDFGGRMVHL